MLLGTIIDKESKIYIKQHEENGVNKISFDKVDEDGITHLSETQSKEILNNLFNTNRKLLEKKDGYDIYLDENNLKRYYKDGKEDFNMFYLNNGEDATIYMGKSSKTSMKKFAFVLGGVVTTVVLTVSGIKLLQKYSDGKTGNIKHIIDDSTDSFEPVTLKKIKSYIFSSDGLSDADKENIYNEDYLSFLLDISDNGSKLYDFNDRFKDISVQYYKQEERLGADGFYEEGTNVIHVLDEQKLDKEKLKSTEVHEFIHLTQANFKYRNLADSLALIMANEYYGLPIDTSDRMVIWTKGLMEIIGPTAVINAVYSQDTTMFEETVRQYLSVESAEDFLYKMTTDDWYNPDVWYSPEEKEVAAGKINALFSEMMQNKYIQNIDRDEFYYESGMYKKLLHGEAENRIYFNNKKSEYYNDFPMGYNYDYETGNVKGNYDESLIFSNGKPRNVDIICQEYSSKQFSEMVKNPNFRSFVEIFDSFDINYDKYHDISYSIKKDGKISKGERKDPKGFIEYTDYLADIDSLIEDIEHELNNHKKGTLTFNGFKGVTDEKNFVSLDWKSYQENPFIIPEQSNLRFNYDDSHYAIFKDDETIFKEEKPLEVPSIYKKFGAIQVARNKYKNGNSK